MRGNMAIRWTHRALTAILLVVVVGFLYLNHTPDYRSGDVLVSSHKIADRLWLYRVKNDSGGATVDTVYRYYLADGLHGTDTDKLAELKKGVPFLEGDGSISAISEGPGVINVQYSGDVASLDRTASYQVDGASVSIRLAYSIK